MIRLSRRALLAAGVSGIIAPTASLTSANANATSQYEAIEIGALGGRSGVANSINASGAVVGSASDGKGADRAFLWQDGEMRDLGKLGGLSSGAFHISESGHIAGWSDDDDGNRHAVLWLDDRLTQLDAGAGNSAAYAVNASGVAVGFVNNGGPVYQGTIWRDGEPHSLGSLGGVSTYGLAINDVGHVVGWSKTDSGVPSAFRWVNGEITALETLGGPSVAFDISDADVVVGSCITGDGNAHAVMWRDGELIDLGSLGWFEAEARGIARTTHTVGSADLESGSPAAFVSRDGIMTAIDASSIASEAFGINESGWIVGYRSGDDYIKRAVVWRPLP
ncbi:MAG: hypothetical protein IT336_11600 [Thermomicrobiales bacterium]|nr:hypothetical protein [Thermomicrobiales bacterium]